MRTLGLPLVTAAMLAFAMTPSLAQNDPNQAGGSHVTAPGNAGGSDVSPDDKGATGWNGGTRGPTSPKTDDAADAALAADQPLMATGLDLRGPPVRHPPSQTPE
jgi:hypothetical protein